MLVSRTVYDHVGPFDGSIFCGDALFSWKAGQAGFIPWYAPRAIVTDQDEKYREGFLLERNRRGREFGRVRARFEKWTRLQLFARTALAPVAVLAALARIAFQCYRGGRQADFLATLLLQIASQVAWCFGEAMGYWSVATHRGVDDKLS